MHKLVFHVQKTLALWLEPAKNGLHLLGSQEETIRAVSGTVSAPRDHPRVGVEQLGALLIKREVLGESILPIWGSPGIAEFSTFQKLSRFGQGSGKEWVSLMS